MNDVFVARSHLTEIQYINTKNITCIRMDGGIWLPVGFNPDTGKLQIMELIDEAIKEFGSPHGLSPVIISLFKIKELIS